MGPRRYSKPIKPHLSLSKEGRNDRYRVSEVDIDTGVLTRRPIRFETEQEAEEYVNKKRREIGLRLLSGDYDTNEKRIRDFIKYHEEESDRGSERLFGNKPAEGSAFKIAAQKAKISDHSAVRGVAVINKIDELRSQGKEAEAIELSLLLNQAIKTAYRTLEPKYKTRKTNADNVIWTDIYKLARRFDNRHELKGGSEYRDECVSLLKQLSAKFDEWRASE